jgi:tetratricopeptide (TPR) repeat protein
MESPCSDGPRVPAGPDAHVRARRGSGRRLRRAAAVALLVPCVLAAHGCALPPARSGSGVDTVQIVTHTVSEGESLSTIADDYYGTPLASSYLAGVNGIESDSRIEPGAVIEVPAGEEDLERYRRRTEAKIFYNRGTLLAEAGEYDGAGEEFTLALKADPRFADAGYNLGVVLLAGGEPARAAAVLEQVLTLRPDEPSTEFALGKALFDAGRTEEALDHFDRATALDPVLEEAHFARAVALLRLDRREEAIFALDRYLRDFPNGAWSDQARSELRRMAREQEGR